MEHSLQHIAFALDGNRRWAKEQGLTPMEGHTAGFDNSRTIIEACAKRGITYTTLYAWSTENHKNREEKERLHIFNILESLKSFLDMYRTYELRFGTIGNLDPLPLSVRNAMAWLKKETAHYTKGQVTIAINYGGRDEITRAVQKIVQEEIPARDITEEVIANHLDTAGLPYPDLMIRTGKGNIRTSNFLPWQLAYAELYFPGVYWPDFNEEELDKAIEIFEHTKRNFGK